RAEVEPLIGFFVNTLAMRVQLDGAPSVAQLLERVKQVALGAYAHQDLPFEQVVEALKPVRSLAHSPVFQAMLTMNVASEQSQQLPGLTLSGMEQSVGATKFDLTLALLDQGEEIGASIIYASDLFEASSVARIGSMLVTLLCAMVATPQEATSRLPLLDAAQRTRLLDSFNETDCAFPEQATIHNLFAAQAQAQPEAPAVVCEGRYLSYGELERRANQVAHGLLARGAGPGVAVALCVERSVEMVVGLLGILKAPGGARPAGARRRPRRGGGAVRRAQRGDGGGPAGHPEGGRGLCAARPAQPAAAPGLPAAG
ncbi:condensation domain-containing protein, partial [Duganella sp. Root1480D1]|uniref:condensation domain-containing protein n=1 Tax=Duganella sp. Root1480D1 TaxID=1736471 RepID=UPI000B260D1B